jgi:ParB-like chromosome segregation protein Spo0J
MTDQYQLFDALPAHIEDALRASIERFGVLVPVTVDQHGNMLDGHHRERLAKQLKVPYDRLVRVCDDDDERREIARTLNSDRRHLSEEQRRTVVASLATETVTIRGEEVAKHSPNAIAGALGVSLKTVQDDIDELTTTSKFERPEKALGLDGKVRPTRRPQVIARDNREQQRAQTALAVVPEVNANRTLDVKRIERVAREQQAEERRAAVIEEVTGDGEVEIRHGDFRKVLDDLTGTVDAIITDPPYEREYDELWEPLGEVARRLLKPTGVLAVMCGTRLDLIDHARYMLDKHMKRRHIGVYLTPGQRWRDQVEKVAIGWKPIFLYSHPDVDVSGRKWINDDVFTSSGTREQDTRFHHWGQNEFGIADLIRGLTEPGQLIVDPFLGGGTAAVVCRDLGRRFIGCDVDANAVSISRERLG